MNELMHDISWVVPLRSDFLTPIFEFLTWLGYPTFMMLMLPLGFWLWSKTAFTRVTVIVLISTVLNAFLKDLWENPRPDLVFRLDGEVGNSFGMPSGHAQVSAVLWFWLAYEIRKTWAWIMAGIIVLGICFSRLYLGIHDLEDILAGLSIALVTLLTYRAILSTRFEQLLQAPLWLHLLVIVLFGVVAISVWPSAENSIGAVVVFGLLFTWILGVYLESRIVGFIPRQEVWVLATIAVLGIVGLTVLLAAVKPLLIGLNPLLAGTINTAILGLYMTLAAPMLFKLCGLHVAQS